MDVFINECGFIEGYFELHVYLFLNTNYNFLFLPLFLLVFNIKHNIIITMATRIRRTPPPTPIVIAAHMGSVVVDSVIVF